MKVLVACEFSGIVREAFKAKGHDAWSCDLLPTEIPGQHIQGDVLEILNNGWDLMIAHLPCTYLTVTCNKWFNPEFKDRFPERNRQRQEAVGFFMSLINANINKIAVENPVGIMSSLYRRPDCIIQPFNYGEPVRKTTCLWLKNLPPLMSLRRYPDELVRFKSGATMSKFHCDTVKLSPHERMKARSRTFPGIANAMADQWG